MSAAARYRIRFLLQEIDLVNDVTVFGRGEECHVTLHDDLVSSQHACIDLTPDGPILRDLDSRNGVTLNGARLGAAARLAPGDRFRVGQTEMVFCVVEETPRGARSPSSRQTGRDAACRACGTVRSDQVAACPACGARADC